MQTRGPQPTCRRHGMHAVCAGRTPAFSNTAKVFCSFPVVKEQIVSIEGIGGGKWLFACLAGGGGGGGKTQFSWYTNTFFKNL